MKTIDECSSVHVEKGKPDQFVTVMEKLTGAKLPVLIHYKYDAYHFYYDGKCDGNTAYFLQQIIGGLIALYKS